MPVVEISTRSQLRAADFPVGILMASNWLSCLTARGSESFGRSQLLAVMRKCFFEIDGIESPRMSPDASQVAFNFTKDGIINVATMPVMGGELKQLTYDRELAGWPCWSPDGQFLALEIERGDDTHIAIIRVRAVSRYS
jgi:hypothetical protein